MEGVVEGDGSAEGRDNLNQLPSTSGSVTTNVSDSPAPTPIPAYPSSSGTQGTENGKNCD